LKQGVLKFALRYYLDPFGCVKNQVDAENMMAHLDHAGFTAVQDAADADIIIINSCGFIESAKRESINAVLNWRKLYPDKKILLAGCLAQRYARELSDSLPEADGFFGVNNISSIVETVSELGIRDQGSGIRECSSKQNNTSGQYLGSPNNDLQSPVPDLQSSSDPLLQDRYYRCLVRLTLKSVKVVTTVVLFALFLSYVGHCAVVLCLTL
jgi:hypothetical protein